MGWARQAGAGHWANRWRQRNKERDRAALSKGIPVPGTGVRHHHKSKSGSNKSGSLSKLNLEWSGKGRKEEDDLRGINNRARHQAIVDQLADLEEDDSPVQYFFDELGEFHE